MKQKRAHDSQIVRAKENLKLSHGGSSYRLASDTKPPIKAERIYIIIINITEHLKHHPCQTEQPMLTTSTPTARPQSTVHKQPVAANRQPQIHLQDQEILEGNGHLQSLNWPARDRQPI